MAYTRYVSEVKDKDNNIYGVMDKEARESLEDKYEKPAGGIPASDLASGVIPTVPVQDVQVNGTSVLANGVADIPIASSSDLGLVKVNESNGIGFAMANVGGQLVETNTLSICTAALSEIKTGTNTLKPVAVNRFHQGVFYGLAKAAGVDASSNSVGTYTDEAKAAIQSMLGVSDLIAPAENNLVASKAYSIGDIFSANGKLYKATAAIAQDAAIIPSVTGEEISGANCVETNVANENIKDVQVDGTSIVQNGVANVPMAQLNGTGVVKIAGWTGVKIENDGTLNIRAAGETYIKAGTNNNYALSCNTTHAVAFYGLAKAAGDTTQAASDNAVGTYTDEAKAAIKSMIGVNVEDVQVNGTSVVQNGVANIPVADSSTLGVVKVDASNGVAMASNGNLYVQDASDAQVKAGTAQYRPISPRKQDASVFYGLAKAAGDTTQSVSNNAVGAYTDEAKTAIQTMLGIDLSSIASQVEIPLVETVSGAAVTITGQPNTRYVCGEVTSISITPPASGSVDVVFTSGSTVAVLTLPSSVRMPEWFDPSTLDTNTTYEILITDGVYGSVMTWAA